MADIRIKDLTTTASSTASDDFIAVDGTTNGTRKLSAFSPTFGGNVVVTGTLTSQSTLSTAAGVIAQNADIIGGYMILRGYSDQNGGLIFLGQSSNNNFIQSNATTIGVSIAGTGVTQTVAAGFRVLSTTVSTSTSSGALVVGNGTSGGLGVGGAIVAGGTITSTTSTDSGVLQLNLVNSSTGTSASSLFRFNAGTRTVTLQAYNDTHATLAGQLRVGTSNGDIVLIPSGVAATTFGSSTVTVNHSTASTSTSSGALVVSGGVGVGDAVSVGGRVRAQLSVFADPIVPTSLASAFQVDVQSATVRDLFSFGDQSRHGLIRGAHDGSGNVQFRFGRYTASTFEEQMRLSGTTAASSSLTIYGTTASTSTSSGALVVSGGVGVAGNTVVGGASFTTGDGSGGPYLASSSVIDHSSGQARFYGRGANTSTRATLGFYSTYSDGTGGITLQTFDVSGNATFGASIKTSAPSGGTAAAWKLGTVASVSPTSPNRTIEVDIGGTIYYIHAKTTNN